MDDQSFKVRQNLFNFLEPSRNRADNTCFSWIDQLCIDQANTLKKTIK